MDVFLRGSVTGREGLPQRKRYKMDVFLRGSVTMGVFLRGSVTRWASYRAARVDWMMAAVGLI